MKLLKQINPDIKIMEEDGKYFIKIRVSSFFGLLKFWIYVTHQSYCGRMYKPFYSIESAEKFINNQFKN